MVTKAPENNIETSMVYYISISHHHLQRRPQPLTLNTEAVNTATINTAVNTATINTEAVHTATTDNIETVDNAIVHPQSHPAVIPRAIIHTGHDGKTIVHFGLETFTHCAQSTELQRLLLHRLRCDTSTLRHAAQYRQHTALPTCMQTLI